MLEGLEKFYNVEQYHGLKDKYRYLMMLAKKYDMFIFKDTLIIVDKQKAHLYLKDRGDFQYDILNKKKIVNQIDKDIWVKVKSVVYAK